MQRVHTYHIKHMRPYFRNLRGTLLRLVLVHSSISLMNGNDEYFFTPLEGKEIYINLATKQFENTSDIFVFKKGEMVIRLSLYQLLSHSNIRDSLPYLINGVTFESDKVEDYLNQSVSPETAKLLDETVDLIKEIDTMHLRNLIDSALDNGDYALFMDLTNRLNNLNKGDSK